MTELVSTFTSTGAKFFAHQEAMRDLRNGKGHPIVTHLMPTDICNHGCAFCSVQTRIGKTLPFQDMLNYLDLLIPFGLKAVIISGGGNPILYKYRDEHGSHYDFNDLVEAIRWRGLEIGLITNGMPLEQDLKTGRKTWKGITSETLGKLTWCRISMSGFDHPENEVYVPDFDRSRTTLGFSYVLHDTYNTPEEPNHGQVSTYDDAKHWRVDDVVRAEERIDILTGQILEAAVDHEPAYIRLLPNCLEPAIIPHRIQQLQRMADRINLDAPRTPAFVQYKPPSAPKKCFLGYIHPVLNSDGYVYPCDSCVLNETADHKFANPWRVCHWSEVAKVFKAPVRSLIENPGEQCKGCVFPASNAILQGVVEGAPTPAPDVIPQHVNFV